MIFKPSNYSTFNPEKLHVNKSYDDKYYVKQYKITYDGDELCIQSPESTLPYGISRNKFKQIQATLETANFEFMKFIKKIERCVNEILHKDFNYKIPVKILYKNHIYLTVNSSSVINVNSERKYFYESSEIHTGKIEFIIPFLTFNNNLKTYSIKPVMSNSKLIAC